MTMEQLDIYAFRKMLNEGAEHLSRSVDAINALNVFPVPDGDTGTNMNLTMSSGIKELEKNTSGRVGESAEAFSKGLLMGARGNSGVILSQLFRGFSKAVVGKKTLNAQDFGAALEAGVDNAYKAVIKPVEGTILTVAKDAAKRARQTARKTDDIVFLIEETVQAAQTSLKRTPELLNVLKEVGVVDSGGQGLVAIYEGFLGGLTGKAAPEYDESKSKMKEMISAVHHKKAQLQMRTEDIKYGYCTEFMVKFKKNAAFDEESFREKLAEHGDSLLVVSDPELVKVHIHTEKPGDMLSLGQQYGELVNMKIDNMRSQHREILTENKAETVNHTEKPKGYAIVAVAAGSGLAELFESMGTETVIEGGQTMNPSIEDIVDAIERTGAETVFILPNNGNVVMAAQQAIEVGDRKAIVIPTKTIPQGLSALIAFNPEADDETNEKQMKASAEQVKSGLVTFAVRDTKKDGLDIKEGDFIALTNGEIVAADEQQFDVVTQLLEDIVSEDDGIVTIIYGSDGDEEEAGQLADFVETRFPSIEVEVHNGGQPVYSYIISVE